MVKGDVEVLQRDILPSLSMKWFSRSLSSWSMASSMTLSTWALSLMGSRLAKMLKDAPIIILDEATASVDPENEHLIQSAISELTRGKTIITIAHRLATIEQADQILVVDDGRIVEQGTHAQLIRQPGRYQQFVRIREKAEGWNL